MKKEENIVICMPSDSPDLIPGGFVIDCADCGKELMVAQSTSNLLKERGLTDTVYLCMSCVVARAPEDFKVVPPSQEQIDEVINHIKTNP